MDQEHKLQVFTGLNHLKDHCCFFLSGDLLLVVLHEDGGRHLHLAHVHLHLLRLGEAQLGDRLLTRLPDLVEAAQTS